MNIKSRFLFSALIASGSLISTLPSVRSQSPQPVIVQAVTGNASTTTTQAQSAVVAQNAATIQVAIQTLEKIKAANDEVLKRQRATLEQLETMQQAADELKIFAKRG